MDSQFNKLIQTFKLGGAYGPMCIYNNSQGKMTQTEN
jgi:hypothetical protein